MTRTRYTLFAVIAVLLALAPATQSWASWQVHTNVKTVRRLLAYSNSVWAVTSGGLYRHDDLGSGFDIINTGDGLGDHDLNALARSGDSFWVAGANRVLSVWVAGTGETERFPLGLDITTVEALCNMGNTLWIGCDRGVGLFDKTMQGGLLKEVYTQLGTLPMESGVRELELYGGLLWVCAEAGMVSADPGSPSLHVPSSWTHYADPTGALSAARRLEVFQDSLFVASDSGLYVWTGSTFAERSTVYSVRDLAADGDTLWLATDSGAVSYSGGNFANAPTLNLRPADLYSVAKVPGGNLWVAFPQANLYEYGSFQPWFVEHQVNQPPGSTFSGLDQAYAILYCAQWEQAASFLRSDGAWFVLPGATPSAGAPTLTVRGLEPFLYVCGAGAGVHVTTGLTDQVTFTQYNSANSALEGVAQNPNYTVVSDVAAYPGGGFWAANREALNGQALVFFGPNGTPQVVYGQADGLPGNDISALLLSGDRLWIAYNGAGLGVLEFAGTPTVRTDDTYTHYTQNDIALPTDVINCLVEGFDHHIWAGTPAGLVRLDTEFFPFLSVEPAHVEPAGNDILCLEQDVSGAIWAGTSRGLVRLPNGQLTPDSTWFAGSSPLPNERVRSLKHDDWAPRMWIGTQNGLAVLDLVAAQVSDAPNVFPNPFEIRYSGDRATFEVPAGSVVDIFTLAGDRVFTLTTDYQWDGNNESGTPVASGLYLYRVKFNDGSVAQGRLGVVR